MAAHLTNVPMDGSAISLIVDGLDGSADILKFGFHYTVAGFDIYFGEVALISAILVYFGYLNIKGVKKAGIVQTVMSTMLVVCVFILFIAGLTSAKASGMNLQPAEWSQSLHRPRVRWQRLPGWQTKHRTSLYGRIG